MATKTRLSLKKILTASVWLLLCVGIVVLLVAAIRKKDSQSVAGVSVNISGARDHIFVNEKEVMTMLEKVMKKPLVNAPLSSVDLVAMEKKLQKEKWIRSAEMFFDNNNVLQVNVLEREPVARIFTTSGASFYLDSSLMRLPVNTGYAARLPVFTSFPTEVKVLTHADSVLLKNIRLMGEFLRRNEFWMAQIEQVDITPSNTFELIPKLGNQVVRFGNMNNYREKFNNLLAFYKKVQVKTGWNKYSVVDVQFNNQVVAVRRDAREVKADSVRAVQIMKNIILEAQKRSSDSSDIQLDQKEPLRMNISRSQAREEIAMEAGSGDETVTQLPPAAKPVAKPAAAEDKKGSSAKAAVKKDVKKKPEGKKLVTKQPKAVMPPAGN